MERDTNRHIANTPVHSLSRSSLTVLSRAGYPFTQHSLEVHFVEQEVGSRRLNQKRALDRLFFHPLPLDNKWTVGRLMDRI